MVASSAAAIHDVRVPPLRFTRRSMVQPALLAALAALAGATAPVCAQSKEAAKPAAAQKGGENSAKLSKTGTCILRVTTDGSGRVVTAVVVKSIHPTVDAEVVRFAKAKWHGPPHSTRDVPVSFTLDGGNQPATKTAGPVR